LKKTGKIGTIPKSSIELDDGKDGPMTLKFDRTKKSSNTQFGPVAALLNYFDQQNVLEPLQNVVPAVKKRDFSLASQLTQILLSILTGCEYLSQVNTRLRPERKFAQVYRISQFADQSTLSRTLDGLSLANLTELEQAVQTICQPCSRTRRHDWRGFLQFDFDLSGLPCGKQAQGSQKGYFSGKKMLRVGN
jgi:hypothetical protein